MSCGHADKREMKALLNDLISLCILLWPSPPRRVPGLISLYPDRRKLTLFLGVRGLKRSNRRRRQNRVSVQPHIRILAVNLFDRAKPYWIAFSKAGSVSGFHLLCSHWSFSGDRAFYQKQGRGVKQNVSRNVSFL